MALLGDDKRNAKHQPATIQLIDPFAHAERRLAVLTVVDELMNVMRLAGCQYVLVILYQRFRINLPDQLAVSLTGDVFTSKVIDCPVAPKVAPFLIFRPAQERHVLEGFEVFDLHSRFPAVPT